MELNFIVLNVTNTHPHTFSYEDRYFNSIFIYNGVTSIQRNP